MKKTALVLLLVSAAAGSLQAQSNYTPMVTLRRPLVNIGVKAGFNSSMFFIDELSIDGKELEGVQNNYKVGYFATVFCRLNLKKASFHPAGNFL